MELKSTGRAIDEDEDDEGDQARPIRQRKSSKKPSKRRSWSPEDGMPVGVVLAISAIAILMVLNGLAALSIVLGPNLLLIVPAIRVVIEARVISGLRQRLSQTRLSGTVMATLMLLTIIALGCFLISDNPQAGGGARDPFEVKWLKVVLGIQLCCELVVIVGLNLATSRRYLSE